MFSGIHTAKCNAKKNTNANILKLTFFYPSPTQLLAQTDI